MSETSIWHEDPELWESMKQFLFPPEKYEEAADQMDDVIDLLDLSEGDRILDMACGIGRHSVELASRGFDVTGVDATQTYIEDARQFAQSQGVDVTFVHQDMREFYDPNAFDAILNMYTSFG
ncbi:MAG: class I SAM-dependent methyltransferase, partial [Halobacteriaceae archaeon]